MSDTPPGAPSALSTADPQSHFSRMLRGEVARAPVLDLLDSRITFVDAQAGVLCASYTATDAFRNPAGTVQGGLLGAMLDDLSASLVDATLKPGEAVATLSLNLSFLRPAQVGALTGEARMQRRGRDVCHVSAALLQHGKEVASATAVCKIITL